MRRNCQVVLDVNAPAGYQYSFNRIKLRGYATLEAGVTATVSSSVYYQGASETETRSKTVAGPYRDSLFFQPIVPAAESTIGFLRATFASSAAFVSSSSAVTASHFESATSSFRFASSGE